MKHGEEEKMRRNEKLKRICALCVYCAYCENKFDVKLGEKGVPRRVDGI
jgi:hypothetical protein